MITPVKTIWTILKTNMPHGRWVPISELYEIIERNYNQFTTDDLFPVTSYNNELTWHRNMRDVLQDRRRSREIYYDGSANYRIDKPYVWQMIKEAIEALNSEVPYSKIKAYINSRWPDVNQGTIIDQIIVLTVNHLSRIHYPENFKVRKTNSNSPYDLLFSTGRGKVIKYNPEENGIWEIYINESLKPTVRKAIEVLTRKIYTPTDIVWIKNVTSRTAGTAYLDINDTTFILHFPTIHKHNVLTPGIDEIILIRQNVDGIPAFTHLVTPIDKVLIEDNEREDYRYGRRVKIIAKTNQDNFITVSSTSWGKINFAGITQGNACKIENIKNIGNIDELQYNIWEKFNEHFIPSEQQSANTTSVLIAEIQASNPDLTVKEGELHLVAHLVKERSRKIIAEKKEQAMRNGTLFCEVCNFSFKKVFNKDFIECHHIAPIGQLGVRETTLGDLALVCANCHRMLHSKFDGLYLSINQLRIMKKQLEEGS